MKKILFLFITIVFAVTLVACSESESVEGEVVNNDQEETTTEETNEVEEDSGTETQDINQSIADDENVSITLLRIEKIEDDIFGNSIEVVFEVENKTDRTLEVQADSVSADGKMVDETILSMSQEVAPGKIADAKLSFMEFEGHDFPALEQDLELTLNVFDWDDFDFSLDYPVSISFE
ncbi:hypothetical protein GGQ92_002419 [Gracilibacillus halotolerans]|uniref:DUF4352 domain-containing protein n=1 Tax=Gracilibacillus halotolerans TaxID=74386 RepID=A0A841RQW8_9BACI|nr:hypothetical protein [Gracilibacillus halotolerans]MBB6513605.1 hypothetical protein [Gracilibacillus halotolerans]